MNKQFFLDMMAARRLSMRGLAQRMGLQHTQLSLTFSGQRKMQLEEAAQLSQIFGVPLNLIATNAGVSVRPTSGRRVYVIGFVGKDGAITLNPPDVSERTEAPDDMPDDAVAVQCRTAGTPLDFCDGWVAFFRRSSTVDAEAIGRMSYVKIKDGPCGLATVKRGYQPGTFNLLGIMARQNVVLEHASPVLIIRP